MRKRNAVVLFLVVLIMLLAGCGARQKASSYPDQAMPAPSAPEFGRVANSAFKEEAGRPADAGVGVAAGVEQKLIQNAERSIEVENMDAAVLRLEDMVKTAGGLVADSSQSGRPGENRYASFTLRVPVLRFDGFLEDVDTLGKVTNRRKYAHDVTLQYIDLEARIRNLTRQEERLLEILERADTVEDILRVEQELGRVRGQLESLSGEFRYLRDRVDYSTIYVHLSETPAASAVITSQGLRGVFGRGMAGLVRSVNTMLAGFGNLVVTGFTLLPYLLLMSLAIIPVLLFLRRRGKTPRAPQG